MAAGLGFKDFATGEVLTAADVDGYLMQGVWVFASAAARDAAVTSPQEGNFAYLKDTNVTTYYTGSAWANLDTTGMTNPMTTTGDTIYSSSGSTPARLGIGSTGNVLTVAGGVPTWAAPAAGGMTLISTTTLSGSSISLTSIPQTYIHLQLIITGYLPSTSGQQMFMRFNGNSSANNYLSGYAFTGDVDNSTFNATEFNICGSQSNSDSKAQITVNILNYAVSGVGKFAYSTALFNSTAISNDRVDYWQRNGYFLPTDAITSLSIRPVNPNFSGGTAYLYGVK
jgi:hypothetical protein